MIFFSPFRNSDNFSTCDTYRTKHGSAEEADGDFLPALRERQARQLGHLRVRKLHPLRRAPGVAGTLVNATPFPLPSPFLAKIKKYIYLKKKMVGRSHESEHIC